jgi:hypothetical protein
VDLRERLGPEAAAVIPGLLIRPWERKAPVPTPWRELLDDLEETAAL